MSVDAGFDAAALLAGLGVSPHRITVSSRDVRHGDAFAAVPGARADGRAFIADAIARGASAVVWEASGFAWNEAWTVANVPVPNLREHLGALADVVYGSPSRNLWMVGVTGTNGKTTCAYAVAQALEHCGRRAAVIGTLGSGFVGAVMQGVNTTPDAALVHETLARLRAAGAKAVAMEVSSHGLEQGRVNGVAFDVALFTNLSRDHLDYHGTMEAYGAAKERLFDWPALHARIVNGDDPFGAGLAQRLRARNLDVLTYGFGAGDVRGSALRETADGIAFDVVTPWGRGEVRSRLLGAFNASNVLGVLSVLLASDIALEEASAALATVEAPTGRMQRLGGGACPLVVVDYAHSPDALQKVLGALRPVVGADRELVCVFGCGGNRDVGKRPQMGRIAGEIADRVIVTDDNPRDEDPASIAAAIVDGLRETAHGRYRVQLDRGAAIREAVTHARAGDVVLVAGKGHEDYQERRGVREHFSDVEVARRALEGLGATCAPAT